MSDGDLTITRKIHFATGNRGRREIKPQPKPAPPEAPNGRVPRVARLMALAIRFDDLIRSGAIADQAEIARLSHVTRERVTQIMNLLHLAPDIQEEILFLPRTAKGHDAIAERHVRRIAAAPDWQRQRRPWFSLWHAAADAGAPQ